MKYLGIDYGEKRVGVAVSDDAGRMGFPREVYENTPALIEKLAAYAREQKIEGLVMGESKDNKGEDNFIMADARDFGEQLSRVLSLPLFYEPEMFSTQEARRDFEGIRTHGVVDSSAAALVLTSFLERQRNTAPKETAPEGAQKATKITIDDLAKVEIRVGTVLRAEKVEGSEKLLKCSIDFGEESGPRQILSGIQKYVEDPSTLVGRQLAYVTNLLPRKMMGMESDGMLLAVGEGETFAFLSPDRSVPPGTPAH